MSTLDVPSRRRDAERNRGVIVAAAAGVLKDDPEASVADVAVAAGLSRATVYGHFATREQLVGAVLDQAAEQLHEVACRVGLPDGDPAMAVARFVLAGWAYNHQNPNLRVCAARTFGDDAFERRFAPVRKAMLGCVRRGQRCGAFRGDLDATFLAASMHALVPTLMEAVAEGRLATRRPAQATALAALGILGIAPERARELVAEAERKQAEAGCG